MKNRVFRAILIVLSLLATIKICILGLGIDEEYAVTMAYRMVTEDRMFMEMWEPHQTSGFLTAFLTWIYVQITGGTEYLIIYLRLSGAVIQALISLFLYRTIRQGFPEDAAFCIAIFFYNTLPKWIQTPEFANMLVWFSTLAFACFLRYYMVSEKVENEKVPSGRSKIWLVAAGVSLSAMVLSYPSGILAIPVILLGMWMLRGHGAGKTPGICFVPEACTVLGTCAVLGISYLVFFLRNMTVEEFIYGLGQMMTDGSHQLYVSERILAYGQELLRLLGFVAAAAVPALMITMICKKLRNIHSFLMLMLIFSLIEQVVYWLGDSRYLQEPLIYFHLLFLAGIFKYRYGGQSEAVDRANRKALFWFGSVAGVSVWLSALAITNTTISVTGSYLMTGLISGILFLWEDVKAWGQKYLLRGFVLCLLGTTLFAKGYLVCSTEGIKDTVALVRQKALYGPAKGIYCRYVDGYVYNIVAELLAEYTTEECPVLYVGEHSLYYMLGSQTISNFSTISTPTYDERLVEYWDRYPERVPKIVVCDVAEEKLDEIRQLLEWGPLLKEQELLQGLENIRVYEILGRRE